jgi:hypothetical protein
LLRDKEPTGVTNTDNVGEERDEDEEEDEEEEDEEEDDDEEEEEEVAAAAAAGDDILDEVIAYAASGDSLLNEFIDDSVNEDAGDLNVWATSLWRRSTPPGRRTPGIDLLYRSVLARRVSSSSMRSLRASSCACQRATRSCIVCSRHACNQRCENNSWWNFTQCKAA